MSIRDYTEEDFPAFSVICRQMHNESQYKDMPFSDEDLYTSIYTALDQGQYFKVVEVDGLVSGFLIGSVYKSGFSPVMIGSDYAMYIHPSFRKGAHGLQLIRDFKRWAKENGAHEVRIGISYGFGSTEHQAVNKIMKSLDLDPSGEWFRGKL